MIEPGGDGKADEEGVFAGELLGADGGEREGSRDRDWGRHGRKFGLALDGGEAMELEILELFEGFGGAALVLRGEFGGAFHLEEELLVGGFGEPAVLGVDFEALGAEGLEAGEGVLLEGDFFGDAVGEGF